MSDDSKDTAPPLDSGLACFILLLRFHGIAVDSEQLTHRYGRVLGATEMLRCAKELGLKARVITSDWERLAKTPLPAIVERRDGSFFIAGKVADDNILVQHPLGSQPQSLTHYILFKKACSSCWVKISTIRSRCASCRTRSM